MRTYARPARVVLVSLAALAACSAAPIRRAASLKYIKDEAWPAFDMPGLGAVGGVVGGEAFVWVAQRNHSLPPILVLEKHSGKLVRTCTFNNSVGDPHNIGAATPTDHGNQQLWIADVGRHLVHRVSCGPGDGDGKTLELVGVQDVNGSSLSPLEFDNVADMDGSATTGPLFVVDGDGGTNNELLKLDASRAVVAHSGNAPGAAPGSFDIPHNVVYDRHTSRVWVADRANMRLQVFSADDLKLLAVWDCRQMSRDGAGRSPYGLARMPGSSKLAIAYVETGGVGGVMFFPDVGVPTAAIPSAQPLDGFTTGNNTLPHGISGDPDGSGDVFVAYITARRVERWRALP